MRECDERAVASAIAEAATAAVRPVYVVLSISVKFALSKYVLDADYGAWHLNTIEPA